MKRTALDARDRRVLALGAWIVVPGLLVRFIGMPYVHTLASVRARIAAEQTALQRDQHAIHYMPALPAARATSAQRLDVERERLFHGNDPFLATAALAQYLANAAQDNGVQLQMSETELAHIVTPGIQALQVNIRAEGDLDGILYFLHHLEAGDKLVRVGALSLTPGTSVPWGSRGTAGGDRDDLSATRPLQNVEVLSLSATVYGYRLDAPADSSMAGEATGAPSPFAPPVYSSVALRRVLEHDLFSPTRTHPAMSYAMALSNAGRPRVVPASPAIPYQQPNLHLIGVVVDTGDASFIYCQNGGAPMQMVHVGENVAGYTLASVDREGAVLTMSNGARVVLPLQQFSLQSSASDRLRRSHHPTADNTNTPGTTQPSAE